MRRRPGIDLAYRITLGVIGTAVVVTGIITIPYPGPGWLIVFTGLAILGTEFHWAHRTLLFLRHRYDTWTHWVRRQPPGLRLVVMAATGAFVLLTLWLVNAPGLIVNWFGLPWDWLRSPLA